METQALEYKLTTDSGLIRIRRVIRNAETARTVYGAMRAAIVASGKFDNAAQFDEHGTFFTRQGGWPAWIQYALSQFASAFSDKWHIPPSEESMAWGEFLGGTSGTDRRPADAKLREVLAPVLGE